MMVTSRECLVATYRDPTVHNGRLYWRLYVRGQFKAEIWWSVLSRCWITAGMAGTFHTASLGLALEEAINEYGNNQSTKPKG